MAGVRHTRHGGKRAFTLIELIVVIAIIIILVVFLVPIIGALLGGKSLKMARNSIDGYFNGLRIEAVNRGTPILVAVLPPAEGTTHTLKIGAQGQTEEFGEGMVAFALDPAQIQVASPQERMVYLGRDLIFASKFDKNITIHSAKRSQWKNAKLPRKVADKLNRGDLAAIGLPSDTFYIYIREDGMAVIPGDIPGFRLDSDSISDLDGDLVLQDTKAVLFVDISEVLKVRARLLSYEELGDSSRYNKNVKP